MRRCRLLWLSLLALPVSADPGPANPRTPQLLVTSADADFALTQLTIAGSHFGVDIFSPTGRVPKV